MKSFKEKEFQQRTKNKTIFIGIDPGTHTGVALWNKKEKILAVETKKIHNALSYVKAMHDVYKDQLIVVFEDARKRTWFGSKESKVQAKQQGAGSVKRDCAIWEDFLQDNDIDFESVKPVGGMTKLDAERFNRLTGFKGRTSEHGRDAAMLVFGK